MARRLMELEKLVRKEANVNNEKAVQVAAETNYKSMQSELTGADIEQLEKDVEELKQELSEKTEQLNI